MNFRMSHGQAMRSVFGCSRVTHFMARLRDRRWSAAPPSLRWSAVTRRSWRRSMRRHRMMLPILTVLALLLALLVATPVMAGGRPFTTTLHGASEVPAGDPDAVGTATVWVNAGTGTVCYAWSVSNAATPIFAAHIHHGVAGVA